MQINNNNPPAGVALGFRRLAIVDLHPTEHQSMLPENGCSVMIFNKKFTRWYGEKKCLD